MATVPMTGVEIFYPIQPLPRSNVTVFGQDSKTKDAVQKSSSAWRHEIVTLKFRIMDVNFKAFYEFHVDNFAVQATLSTPGYYPFLRTATSNEVFIMDFTAPTKPIQYPLHNEMSVTYRNVEITAP